MRDFTIIGLFIALFTLVNVHASAQVGGDDITVAPMAGISYKSARVSVGYDGTIYVGRLISEDFGASYTKWEVVKSTDNGITFTLFVNGGTSAGYTYTGFDMVAAGNNSTDFGLFVARSYSHTDGTHQITCVKYSDVGGPTTLTLDAQLFVFGTNRGYISIALATDSRDKNSFAAPYSISLVAAKAGNPYDSIVAWASSNGGTSFTRRGIHNTTGFIKNVSASIGSANSGISQYGRLGIAWDDFISETDPWGKVYVKYVYGDDGGDVVNGGPHQMGSTTGYRNPTIALSQHTDAGSGFGEFDIRTVVVYEHDNSFSGSGCNLYANVNDSIVNGPPKFYNTSVSGDASGGQINPHISFDVANDKYLITYYDSAFNTLVYKNKLLTSTSTLPTVLVSNDFRQATTGMAPPFPRVDMGSASNKAVFVWNDGDTTKFDAEISHVSIQENTMNLTDLLVYPNPAQEQMTLSFSTEGNDNVQLRVVDMTGKTLQTRQTNIVSGNNMIQIEISNLAEGQYILHINGKTVNGTLSFIVAR